MSASHKRKYPEYKDSGRQWLKEIPSHWSTPKFGQVFQERRTKVSDKDFEALSVTKEGIVPQLATAAKTDHGDNRKLVLKDDFVINSRSDRKGSSGVSQLDGSVSTISIVLEILKGNSRYIHHLLRSHDFKEEFYRLGHGIVADLWSTRFDDIKGELLCFPPENEQERIADFLDFSDKSLVEMNKNLEEILEMLEEKRLAHITSVVTKGLNPDVSMKDSGVDWLGEIPLKWKTGRLSYQCQFIVDGTHHSPENSDEGEYLYISAKNIREYGFDFSKITYITKQDHEEIYKRCPVRKNDVLYIKDGATAGVALVNSLNEEFSLLSSVGLIRPLTDVITPDFLCLYLNSKVFKDNARSGLEGGAMTRFTIDGISRFTVVIPPISEQKEIIEYFQERQINFHKCSDAIKVLIEKIKEYRISLISSAVTGKIDVRSL